LPYDENGKAEELGAGNLNLSIKKRYQGLNSDFLNEKNCIFIEWAWSQDMEVPEKDNASGTALQNPNTTDTTIPDFLNGVLCHYRLSIAEIAALRAELADITGNEERQTQDSVLMKNGKITGLKMGAPMNEGELEKLKLKRAYITDKVYEKCKKLNPVHEENVTIRQDSATNLKWQVGEDLYEYDFKIAPDTENHAGLRARAKIKYDKGYRSEIGSLESGEPISLEPKPEKSVVSLGDLDLEERYSRDWIFIKWD